MKARRATMRDFREIKSSLAPRMAGEYRAAGYDVDEALQLLKPMVQDGRADAITSDENEVLAILFYYVEDGIIQTAFAAKESFFTGMSIRIAKRHLREVQHRLGGLDLQSNSYPQDPRTERWFLAIGFQVRERHPGNVVFQLPGPRS